jgi:glyoxylase-like metal-dependent hydrolase (beta-lactamase superfamily II)/rhodanese-related sulfurtransferase
VTEHVIDSQISAIAFEAAGLGDRSYLIHDGEVGIVVDPQREPARYLVAAEELGVRITHVLETHIHNDYVSGGLGLARAVGATYVLPEGEELEFSSEATTLGGNELLQSGGLSIAALATPGHTPHHLSYLLRSAEGGAVFVCTGGSVLPGGVGRTDLLGEGRTRELAAAQWHSARRLLTELEDSVTVLPTHGFGSFCSAAPTLATTGETLTVAVERARNPAMRASLEEFVEVLVSDPPPIPAYYRYMGQFNRTGLGVPRLEPVTRLDRLELDRLLETGRAIIDLRSRRSFARAYWRGALNIELGANLTTYFGWVVPFEAPYTLIADSLEEIDRTRRMLARIGREHVFGYVLAEDLGVEGASHYPVASFADLAIAAGLGDSPYVLDVRHPSEWRQGHLVGARHVALPDLGDQRSSLPADQQVWVHCAAGYRAAIAASQLSAWGLQPLLIDDGFDQAAFAGLAIEADENRG